MICLLFSFLFFSFSFFLFFVQGTKETQPRSIQDPQKERPLRGQTPRGQTCRQKNKKAHKKKVVTKKNNKYGSHVSHVIDYLMSSGCDLAILCLNSSRGCCCCCCCCWERRPGAGREVWRCRVVFRRSKYSWRPSSEGLTTPTSKGWVPGRWRALMDRTEVGLEEEVEDKGEEIAEEAEEGEEGEKAEEAEVEEGRRRRRRRSSYWKLK